jgi:hypothetical protein
MPTSVFGLAESSASILNPGNEIVSLVRAYVCCDRCSGTIISGAAGATGPGYSESAD